MLRTFAILSLAAGGILATVNQEPIKQDPTKPTGQTAPTSRQDRSSQQGSTYASATTDGYLAKWIVVGQRNEIELSRLAQSRATDPDVKRLAARMVEEHQAIVEKLAPFVRLQNGAVEASSPRSTDVGRRTDRDPADRAPTERDPNERNPLDRSQGDRSQGDRSMGDMRGSAGGELDHAALFEELGQQCLLSARNELESKQGAEFDRCYTGMMLMSHSATKDTLIVFQRHATPEFKPVLAEALTQTEQHLNTTKDLSQRLERKATGSLKNEPGAGQQPKVDGTK